MAALGLSDTVVGLTLATLATAAELFSLAWPAIGRDVPEEAIAGVAGPVAYNATATLDTAALTRPLGRNGLLGPVVIAAAPPRSCSPRPRTGG